MPDDDWALAQGTVDFRNEERRAANRGPQETLFHADGEPNDPAVPRCSAPWCQAGSRRNLCKYEADRAHGVGYGRSRPLGCLLGHDPRTAPFPAGY